MLLAMIRTRASTRSKLSPGSVSSRPSLLRGAAAFLSLTILTGAAPSARSAPPVSVGVDPSADRHPVSPMIYGVNFGGSAQLSRMKFPIRRWGGTPSSRYNWELDIDNSGDDYYFGNFPKPDPGTLPNGSSADVFIDEARAAGSQPLVAVPILGWVPPDRNYRWAFSVAKYGAQEHTECIDYPMNPSCNPDMGNGVLVGGANVVGNDPLDTSMAVSTNFATRWMDHIATRTGRAGAGGVKYFGLDNEPFLWHSSHRDVHPNRLGAVALWQRTSDYASAMKATDPNIEILGPCDWNICAYYFSAADSDGCHQGADWANHGSRPFLQWYLQKAQQYEAMNGVRLLDYLTVHYYPQGTNLIFTDPPDESAATSALRLRSIKSLYDPTYTDESWLAEQGVPELANQAVIPTLKSWINTYYPGTKLAVGEYNWGDGGISSALAQAEILAIFAREGVDMAMRWTAPNEDTLVEDAFSLYMNYNGAGAKVAGENARATSTNVDAVGAYAQRGAGPTGPLYVLLFNKDTAATTANVQIAGNPTGTASLYRFDSANRLGSAGTATVTAGAVSLGLPARSATLAVLPLPGGAPAGQRLYTITPCRVLDTRPGAGTPFGGPVFSNGAPRTYTPAGVCGIPATARALAVNLTSTQATAAGTLVTYPAGVSAPNTIVVQFGASQTRAANTIIGLSPTGSFGILARLGAPGTTHVILDVNGYFE